MIDIGAKDITLREAVVEGTVYMKPSVIVAIKKRRVPKGDALEAAKTAGILAAKNTPYLIPLCHPIPIEYAAIDFFIGNKDIKVRTVVRGRARTGLEMEAMLATTVAALTIYDMCKMLDRGIVIGDIKLIKKRGGKSGIYVRKD